MGPCLPLCMMMREIIYNMLCANSCFAMVFLFTLLRFILIIPLVSFNALILGYYYANDALA